MEAAEDEEKGLSPKKMPLMRVHSEDEEDDEGTEEDFYN